ncbi:MAG: hypothetical protein A2600_12085 [Candidatus Lambdaproteobacteria bacterium RIFOXYD1_FULL_56_27]|uniref:Uncharacterized protein n=1 Tax=Candidatus Lambdaproteobacteria bacterium RIFOXYD2_FULL_56_26 TaxID=1817773 RepID=A0A1F6GWZ0_9PROT|nr:MAG: hypothetical protein A2426_08950 [Candidatus Lambdaproteobacteria bacterium RIFOXYC1_FULL_56_13]OGH02693.1 MAG: hypothetical protein A2557_11460 [Candidatus Lambdaproteobacteria bacterium RIFOXYD2_FULL_56_26]OGH07986.1 MAG: hypothetical protein A2600_12085 [Candidatus Lambdaproteobacteria bacterium RIFOXYD1_FULL_56_27]
MIKVNRPSPDWRPTTFNGQVVMMKSLFVFFFILVGCAQSLWAWDFSDLRKNLKQDLGDGTAQQSSVALVFRTLGREDLKERFNLVEIKRDLAHELAKSFKIPDPLISAEVLRNNGLTYDKLLANANLTEEFAKRNQADLVLLVSIEPKGEDLLLGAKLVTTRNQPLSNQQLELSPKGKQKQARPSGEQASLVRVQLPKSGLKQKSRTVAQFGGEGFNPKDFAGDQNDSWVEMNPTAFLNPVNNFIQATVWAKNLPDTDVRFKRLRYEYTLPDLLQFGFQGNGNDQSGPHSAYAHVKVQVVNIEEFAAAIGYRRRVMWNSENTDFNQGHAVDSFNDKRNKSTLFASVSRKETSLGLLGNLYLDNQQVGLGAKFLVTEEIKVIADSYYNFYDKPLVSNDGAFGVEIHSQSGAIASLVYRVDSAQVHFSFGYSY